MTSLLTSWWWWRWWWIVFVVWLTDERHLALFPARIIIRDPHHLESLTRHEQDLNLQNLSSGFVKWSCAVVITSTSRRHVRMYSVINYNIKSYNIRKHVGKRCLHAHKSGASQLVMYGIIIRKLWKSVGYPSCNLMKNQQNIQTKVFLTLLNPQKVIVKMDLTKD